MYSLTKNLSRIFNHSIDYYQKYNVCTKTVDSDEYPLEYLAEKLLDVNCKLWTVLESEFYSKEGNSLNKERNALIYKLDKIFAQMVSDFIPDFVVRSTEVNSESLGSLIDRWTIYIIKSHLSKYEPTRDNAKNMIKHCESCFHKLFYRMLAGDIRFPLSEKTKSYEGG